jgi:hypothetical protein
MTTEIHHCQKALDCADGKITYPDEYRHYITKNHQLSCFYIDGRQDETRNHSDVRMVGMQAETDTITPLWTPFMFRTQSIFFSFGATAPVWALAYLHETLRFTSVC